MLTVKTAHTLMSLKAELLTKTDMEKLSTMEDTNRIAGRDVINSSEDVQNLTTKVPKLPFAKRWRTIRRVENIATGHGGGERNEV